MAAPPLSNNFNAGTQGATIAATDTGSGNQWDSVQIGASGALIYDNAHVYTGAEAGKVTQPATAVQISSTWSGLGSLTANTYFRSYFYFTAYPASFNINFFRAYNAALGNSCTFTLGSPGGPSAGLLWALNAAGTQIAASLGTVQVSLNQLVRIEWRVLSSTTVGEFEWRLFNTADSTTADQTMNATGQVLAANTDRVDFFAISGDQPSYSWWQDDIAVSTTGWIGSSPLTGTTNLTQRMRARGR